MIKTVTHRTIGPDRYNHTELTLRTNMRNVDTHSPEIDPATDAERTHRAMPLSYMDLHGVLPQVSHVGTEVFAEIVLVEPKTVLKSHSIHGHYVGIRPVRLPNRKLAWPIAEIEKLFETPHHTTSVKEAA